MMIALLAAAAAVQQPAADRQAVLATIDSFFRALEARSPEAILATVSPGGAITAHGRQAGAVTVRTRSWSEWAAQLPKAKEPLREKLIDPRVDVRGTMASVWSYYTFYRGDRFSHCGYDNFDMAKVDGQWRVVNLSYTVEPEGCPRR
jgi:hypothetical protein